MKIRTCQVQYALATGLLLFIAACGGQPPKADQPAADGMAAANFFVGTRPIYAHLVNNKDGSWMFRTITESDEPSDSAYIVRLNDLTPAFDTRVAECTPQVYPESHRCNPANPFRDEDSGVLDKIINGSIAVGTAGKITDITYAYETTFDHTDFNRAVDEALLNTGLDQRRLISLVETYDEALQNASAELRAANEQMQAARTTPHKIQLEIQPTIGGLMEYYEGDIDFAQLVDIEAVEDTSQPTELEAAAFLPCDARSCVAAAETALAELRFTAQKNRELFAAGMRPSSRVYNVRCDMVRYDGYLLQAECPEQVVVNADQPAKLPISVTILSRDFDDLYPALGFGDPDLRVNIDGKTVTFANATTEYLTVSAQTVYYNSTVHTTALPLDIPPGTSITRDLGDFVSQPIDIESRYLQMTPDKARGASFQFGFAVRYRVASQPEERTLHDMGTFNVGCVIRNRVQPGSCQTESLADAGEPQTSDIAAEKRLGPM